MESIPTQVIRRIPVQESALERVRAILRSVAAGEPVDNPTAAAEAAHALAALPPARAEKVLAELWAS